MGLTPHSILDVVEIVFYVLSMPFLTTIVLKQGTGRNGCWIYLTLLAILRIIGGITGVLSQYHPNDQSILETAIITSTIGLSPLLMGWLCVLGRINNGFSIRAVHPLFIQFLHLPIIAATGLAIDGGINLFSDSGSRSNALTYTKIAAFIMLGVLVAQTMLNVHFAIVRSRALSGEVRLIWAGLVTSIFFYIRITYSIIVDFEWGHSNVFSLLAQSSTAVVVQGIMFTLMEFLIVLTWMAAGWLTPKVPRELLKHK